MKTFADVADRQDVVYPRRLADHDGWRPSTIPEPISPLEFDLRAIPFALGFRRALKALLHRDVESGSGVREAGCGR